MTHNIISIYLHFLHFTYIQNNLEVHVSHQGEYQPIHLSKSDYNSSTGILVFIIAILSLGIIF